MVQRGDKDDQEEVFHRITGVYFCCLKEKLYFCNLFVSAHQRRTCWEPLFQSMR